MASIFGRTKTKSGSKSRYKENDFRKGLEKETQFVEHGAGKKTGKGKNAKEIVSVGGQGEIESSSSLEASAGDQKKEEKERRRIKDKSKSKQAAMSPSKIPFPATTPTSPDDLSLRTSAELYQSPEKQRDQQQKLAEVPLGSGISARIPSTASCDSQASGSLVSPNILSPNESVTRFRELEAKLQRSEEIRLEEVQRSKQEHEKTLAELEEKHAAALEEKVKELEKKEQQIKELTRGTTVPRGAEELEDEVDRLLPFEEEVGQLKSQLEKAHDNLHEYEMMEHQLEQEVQNLSATNVQLERALQEQKSEFEGKLKKLEEELRLKTDELEHLGEKSVQLGLQLKQREVSLQRATNVEAPYMKDEAAKSDEVRALEEKLQDKDDELKMLRQQAAGSLVPVQSSLKYDDLPPGTDPMVEIATLKQALESKDRKIESLQVQVRSVEDVIKYAKEQSKQVLELKQELKTLQEGAVALRLQLAAERSEIDRLQHQLEQTEATVRELEIELNTSEATVAQQRAEVMKLQSALSEAETSRRDISQKLAKVKEDYRLLDQKYLSLLAVKENLQIKVSQIECIQKEISQVKQEALVWKNEVAELTQLKGTKEEMAKLKEDVETLRKENTELQGDLEAQRVQAAIWKQDFDRERHEREQAAGRREDEQARDHIQSQQLIEELNRVHTENLRLQSELKLHETSYKELTTNLAEVQEELVKHREQVANMEQIFQSQEAQLKQANQELQECKAQLEQANKLYRNQLDDIHQQLRHANQQLDDVITNNEKLNDDVLAKTQQVKQYKKQVDGLKTELAKHRSQDKEKLMQQLASKYQLLQAARDEQLQLRQQTYEKDRFIQSLLSEKEALTRQTVVSKHVQQGQSQQAQQTNQSEFWEVPRMEVSLNMQKFLGSGAWGFVVEGTFRGQQVAVKCLHDLIRSPKFVEVMRKEIAIMAQVRHPNLVLLIAAVIDTENDPLIVTELLDISLRKAYEKNRLQGSSKLNIFRDIAAALNYLHLHQSGEIIHRDVSSANVLLEAKPNNQWKAKLSDFGSAKLAIEAKTKGPGAPVYSAPEILKEIGICQTAKVDVYSYGILLCEVTVEQFPDEESFPSMIEVVQGKWAFMHHLITSCIQYHPDNRPTMSYILSEFKKLRPQD